MKKLAPYKTHPWSVALLLRCAFVFICLVTVATLGASGCSSSPTGGGGSGGSGGMDASTGGNSGTDASAGGGMDAGAGGSGGSGGTDASAGGTTGGSGGSSGAGGTSNAGTYWVDDNGTATWTNCKSASPLSGASACSLDTANSNASRGDMVYLRAGTYDGIAPSNSGSSGNEITWKAYNSENVTIDCTRLNKIRYYGIYLNGNNYNVIDGITVDCGNVNGRIIAHLENGASYNEIKNCTMSNGGNLGKSGIVIRDTNADDGGSTNNWIHDNTIFKSGYIDYATCQDESGVFYIGNTGGDYISTNNTLENNVIYWGGHHLLEMFTKYNVIRNNVFHNEGFMKVKDGGCIPSVPPDSNGKWGNRDIQIYDGYSQTSMNNLVENNRIGHAGLPPDGGGADGIDITSPENIVRYNFIFNSGQRGIFMKQGSRADSENNRVYNNTVYRSGYVGSHLNNPDGLFVARASNNNVFKNNIFYDSKSHDIDDKGSSVLINNWVTTDGNPLFVNTDISDPMSTTLPNLSLQKGSGAINAGTYLTRANGSETSSTTLVVDDALYFQDGTWGSSLSNIQADWIAIGTVSNRVQISSVDYSTNTVTLESPMTWSNNANIWLYKDSSGKIVLLGSAPDIGASVENP